MSKRRTDEVARLLKICNSGRWETLIHPWTSRTLTPSSDSPTASEDASGENATRFDLKDLRPLGDSSPGVPRVFNSRPVSRSRTSTSESVPADANSRTSADQEIESANDPGRDRMTGEALAMAGLSESPRVPRWNHNRAIRVAMADGRWPMADDR